jgi:hypothetical protein
MSKPLQKEVKDLVLRIFAAVKTKEIQFEATRKQKLFEEVIEAVACSNGLKFVSFNKKKSFSSNADTLLTALSSYPEQSYWLYWQPIPSNCQHELES